MNIVLGVIYAAFVVWGMAANVTAQPSRLENAPIRRWHQFVMGLTFVGALAYLDAPVLLYWVAFVLSVGFATVEDATVKPFNRRRVGTTFALLSVGFWLPALAFGFQPAPAYGALVLIAPAVVCTYVPFLSRRFEGVINTFKRGYKEHQRVMDKAQGRRDKRAAWLARR